MVKTGRRNVKTRPRPDRVGVNTTGVCGTRIFPEARSLAHPPTAIPATYTILGFSAPFRGQAMKREFSGLSAKHTYLY